METFSALLALCAGNSPVTDEFSSQRPVTRSFDVFFDLAWANGWVGNRDAGHLRRQSAHYDVTVIKYFQEWGLWYRSISKLSFNYRKISIITKRRPHHIYNGNPFGEKTVLLLKYAPVLTVAWSCIWRFCCCGWFCWKRNTKTSWHGNAFWITGPLWWESKYFAIYSTLPLSIVNPGLVGSRNLGQGKNVWHTFVQIWCSKDELTYWGWDNIDSMPRTIFLNNLLHRKWVYLDSTFTELYSQGSSWQ